MFGTAQTLSRAAHNMSNLYTHISVEGAASGDRSGHELVALLFDGLLAAIARGRGAIQTGDIPGKGRAIASALRIIGEGLRAGLNMREGGNLARDLNDLYGYIELRLTQANLRGDDAALAECTNLVKTLRDAWSQIAPQVRRGL
ncbi:MAG: flagellar export chaperone FliS [Rubrivivax sp.]|nr:flagellar export chaperone FliS [Rubrivivax sp.]